ncbi:MAG: hypothetical protein AAGF01_23205 [Cyanobacteria bacterium P01_G01_bin.38]
MLYLDAPIGPINGLMIYRDSEDPNLFHYVPERPRLAMNEGVPEFVYLKYKRDITDNPDFDEETQQSLGGGFLAFTVDLGVDDDQIDDMRRELRKFADGEIKLVPIQFRKGSVRLSISKDAADAPDAPADAPRGLNFFEEVYGSSMPSLFGFNRATFSVVLSQEAATLFEVALRSGISPIAVIYKLEFLALRPAFNVRITADYRRIYNHLEAEFGARGQIKVVSLAADIGVAFQKLRDEGSVKIEVKNFTDDKDLRKQADDAFEWFQKELLKDFFESALEPPSFMKRSGSGGLLGQLQNLFGALNSVQSNVSARPQRGTPTTAPATAASPPTSQSSGVQSTTESNRTAAAAGGGGARPSGADGVLSELSPVQVAFSLKFYRQDELKHREFDYSMQAAVAQEIGPQGLFSTIVTGLDLDRAIQEVNLDDEFFKRLISTVSLGTDLESAGISTLAVNLEYPGVRPETAQPLHVDGFTFRPGETTPQTFTTWLNDQKELDYRYRMDIHFKPDSPWTGKEAHVVSPWIVTRDRQLTLNPLDQIGLFDVELSLGDMDSEQIKQVQVELKYEDAVNQFETEKTVVLQPGQAGEHWQLRLSDPDQRTYQYRVTYFLAGNLQYQSEWETSQDPSLVINEPFRNTLDVRLIPSLPDDLIEAVVDVTYQESDTGYRRQVQEIFSPDTDDGLRRRSISVPTLLAAPAPYTYEVTAVRADGSVFQSDPLLKDDSVVLVSDGPPGKTARIRVRLSGADTLMEQVGLVAIKVDLVGPGEDPDQESVIFTPSQTDQKTVTLIRPEDADPFAYQYQITGYDLNGEEIAGESGETSDLTLFVKVPNPGT